MTFSLSAELSAGMNSHASTIPQDSAVSCQPELLQCVSEVLPGRSQYLRDLGRIADDEPAFFLAMGDVIRERLSDEGRVE